MLRGGYGLCRPMLRVELLQVVDYQRMLQCVGLKGGRGWGGRSRGPILAAFIRVHLRFQLHRPG
jgi:hypothetical protein